MIILNSFPDCGYQSTSFEYRVQSLPFGHSRREVSGAGKTEDGLVRYNEEVNRPEDDLRELYETIRVNVDEEEQWKVFDFVEDFFMEELEIGDYINDINSYHLHMFDKHDVTTKKFDL